ncbi:MAG: agmatinase [Candidatus Micrarchaeota archaeon]
MIFVKLLHSLPPFNFCGLEGVTFEKAKVVVLPVPYDSTASYRGGCRDGPHALIQASRNMETYDYEFRCEPASVGIFTLDELEPARGSVEETLGRVEGAVAEILSHGKFPLMIGGEHSITLGAIRAFANSRDKEFSVLHLDAHADMRDEYEGSRFSHACVMSRVRELCDVVSVGVRSMSGEEAAYIKKEKIKLHGADFDARGIVEELKDDVYITFDLDVFDPSEMAAVGTPEPGGIRWKEATGLLRAVAGKKNVIGADVVELCPIPGNIAADFMVAKLAYKMIGYKFFCKK